MEIDSNLTSLLQTLTMADPLTAPRSWESISSESGVPRPEKHPTNTADPIHQPSSITESALVRLALDALRGVKASLVELEEISDTFCSIPADRTKLSTPTVWCRGSSTSALGHFLRSIHSTGLKVFFLQQFINYYSYPAKSENAGKCSFSLVNQAFAVSIRKFLEGYFCALNTLSGSVELRRASNKNFCSTLSGSVELRGASNKNFCSDITLLEVYLHTEELTRFVESIGNICFPKHLGLDLAREDLSTETVMDFHKFLRGAELLSYLYVQFQGADPGHYELLKYLFVRSFEPYWEFIKSWIYQANINDPYEEFFLDWSESVAVSSSFRAPEDELSQFVKERNNVPLPCFLGDVSRPILRTGEQVHVLVKLLSFCNLYFVERGANPESVLPCWFSGTDSQNSSFLLNSLAFSAKSIETLVSKREVLYKTLMEKLREMQLKFDVHSKWVIPFHTKLDFQHRPQDMHASNAGSIDVEAAPNIPVGAEYNGVTYTSDESMYGAQLEKDSTCSSSYDSEEELDTHDVCIPPPKHTNACERLFFSQIPSNLDHQPIQFKDPFQKSRDEELHHEIGAITDSPKEDNLKFGCWPLGSLPKNPFVSNNNCLILEELQSTVDKEEPVFGKGFEPFLVINGTNEPYCENKPSFTGRNYNLSANPILTKATWLANGESGDKNFRRNGGFLGPCFDFSSVATSSGNFSGRSFSVTDSSLMEEQLPVKYPSKVEHLVRTNMITCTKTELNSLPSSEVRTKESPEANVSGGAQWTGSLGYSSRDVEHADSGDCCYGSDHACEMPLDLVMHKCITQDILLQYEYVSSFTIKLLKEGFDLGDHFLALRRYHFMEMADWADHLVASLFNQRWFNIQAEQNIAVVQGLLDLALQRSSCDSDPYKERLFLYVKGEDKVSFSGSASGLHIFDSILLGFRVDWPVSIVITQEALKVYAEIFGYLSQIRFSLFSLTHTWRCLKDLIKANRSPGAVKELNTFFRVRQQINHFVSTLQLYVHSQLSGASWGRFQVSLKHQAKDILDLGSMHMSYLREAVHICFLSAETKPVAAIIRSILQCAIDLRSCFTRVDSNSDTLTLHSLVNFSEISAISLRFESLLKDLHLLYMNSPKHGDLSLCKFWGYLNYNEYYSFAMFTF
ncbi:hypothetical protein LUZ63_006861 [Rhynchospora breviuscula]|uniref:Gamma-tubulin complex component n=1 Tax=Rhynchospora breviuscula TaxID=2022672 RepID=A0A9Q0CQK1_9POAL|nr:hypothetical protein LUZ63_006861 [Rhynchospora breviuscula]